MMGVSTDDNMGTLCTLRILVNYSAHSLCGLILLQYMDTLRHADLILITSPSLSTRRRQLMVSPLLEYVVKWLT